MNYWRVQFLLKKNLFVSGGAFCPTKNALKLFEKGVQQKNNK